MAGEIIINILIIKQILEFCTTEKNLSEIRNILKETTEQVQK